LFYAANTYFDVEKRERLSLSEEQKINEKTHLKIIGITVETRPDTVDLSFIQFIRELGVTRVQLGVQHTDDYVLKKINRKAYTAHTIFALKVLKNFGFKIDIHLMPNLPYATPESDELMFKNVLENPDLQADQWKIYPCEIVPWTRIKKWFEEGKYKPYEDELLKEIIIQVKSRIHPWIRLNRIIRDIPSEYVCGGFDNPSLRDHIKKEMAERGLVCNCIRCREVKNGDIPNEKDMKLTINKYKASGGDEYFISYTNQDESVLYGFLRLRLPEYNLKESSLYNDLYPELPSNIGWIRELHVYGKIQTTYGDKSDVSEGVQHRGLGKRLLCEAERICFENGFKDISVIAGVGTREYYKKRGFNLLGENGGHYMVKPVEYNTVILYENKYWNLLNTKTYLTILTVGFVYAVWKYFV
jgi:ELP3 family radical SAM enzyme/protein acetyltransferase